MDREKYQEIFDQTKKNSIGSEKKDSNKRVRKKVKMMVTIPVLVGTLTAAGVLGVGCAIPVKDPVQQETTTNEYSYLDDTSYRDYGYSDIEIESYGKVRALQKLNDAGFTATGKDGFKYHYDESVEDFKKLGQLDNDYIYSLEAILDDETMSKVYQAMGYENEDDFMVKNNFVDSKGKADGVKWFYEYMNSMAERMHENEMNKGVSK